MLKIIDIGLTVHKCGQVLCNKKFFSQTGIRYEWGIKRTLLMNCLLSISNSLESHMFFALYLVTIDICFLV